MSTHHTTLALCISALLLSACSSGGGTKPAPAPAIPPPPPPAAFNPCPAPVISDCIVILTENQQEKLPAIQSDHALILRSGGQLGMLEDNYRFSGGTTIESGRLDVGSAREAVNAETVLQSDVSVWNSGNLTVSGSIHGNVHNQGRVTLFSGANIVGNVENTGNLYVEGNVRGNVQNQGTVDLHGTVDGNVDNHGILNFAGTISESLVNLDRLYVGDMWGETPNLVGGDFRQSSTATLSILLPTDSADWKYTTMLQVDGRADIEGGTLELRRPHYDDGGAWYGYTIVPLPASPMSFKVLHASGGVFGEFAQWKAANWLDEGGNSHPLFITGDLRYESNDVWFDLSRASLTATMAAAGANPLTVASASNFDRALIASDGFAPASMTDAQHRFLRSAASVLWTRDMAQASRTLDSLAGHAHAAMRDLLHDQAADASLRLDARLAGLAYSTRPIVWSEPATHLAAGHAFSGASNGFDQWLSPRLLVGTRLDDATATLRFDHLGGQGQGLASAAGAYLHYRGDGWHATGLVGAGRASLQLRRPIELDAAGTHYARSWRVFEHAYLHGEAGRDIAFARGRLTPFAAFDYGILRSDGFAELGDTGFELNGAADRRALLSGALGARYARQWDFGRSTLRMDLGASYRRDLHQGGTPLRAAFQGVPDAWFVLPSERRADRGELRLRLGGRFGPRWHWSMDYLRDLGGAGDDVQLGLRRSL